MRRMRALIDLLIQHDFLLVFLVTLAARIGAPVPAAPLLVVAGGLAAAGRLSAVSLVVAAVLANVLGDAIWFIAGRSYGHRVLRLLCRVSLSPDVCVRQSESLIARWGGSSLLAAKFLPGISVVAAPMAGALGMGWRRFIAYDAVAGLVWTACFLGLGLVFSDQIQDVLDFLSNAGMFAVAAIVAVLALLVGNRWRRRRQMAKLQGEVERISVEDAAALCEQDMAPIFIDVRSDPGRAADPRTLPGALNIPLTRLPEYAAQLPERGFRHPGRARTPQARSPPGAGAGRRPGRLARTPASPGSGPGRQRRRRCGGTVVQGSAGRVPLVASRHAVGDACRPLI